MTLDDLTPEAAMLENLRSVPMSAFQREATKAALGRLCSAESDFT